MGTLTSLLASCQCPPGLNHLGAGEKVRCGYGPSGPVCGQGVGWSCDCPLGGPHARTDGAWSNLKDLQLSLPVHCSQHTRIYKDLGLQNPRLVPTGRGGPCRP